VVVIVNAPPEAVTVTFAVAVVEPALFFAVSVYVVVAVGFTLVEPLAEVEVNVPGVMAMLDAPLVAQLSVLLEPEVMLEGLAVNELIVGLLDAVTVTIAVEVIEPVEFVAVSVYVVVAVGLTLVVPLADVEENVPGEIATVVAPDVLQLSVLLAPELIPAGLAVKELIAGSEPFSEGDALDEPHPSDAAKAHKIAASAPKRAFPPRSQAAPNLLVWRNLAELMRTPSVLPATAADGHAIAAASVKGIAAMAAFVALYGFSPTDHRHRPQTSFACVLSP
jgi:hypothetical protein